MLTLEQNSRFVIYALINSKGTAMRGQLNLNIYRGKRGGLRPGCGRKRIHSQGVAHRRREKITARTALHINFKVRASIRNKHCLNILKRAIRNSRSKGLRVVHFSLQSNHVHLIVEATHNAILTKGIRSLTITFSKGIARGQIQMERYHLHVLKTVRETKNALHYVLLNEQKHSGLKKAHVDDYSSLGTMRGLRELAQSTKMTILLRKIQEINFLDAPKGWMIRQVLNHRISART